MYLYRQRRFTAIVLYHASPCSNTSCQALLRGRDERVSRVQHEKKTKALLKMEVDQQKEMEQQTFINSIPTHSLPPKPQPKTLPIPYRTLPCEAITNASLNLSRLLSFQVPTVVCQYISTSSILSHHLCLLTNTEHHCHCYNTPLHMRSLPLLS